MSFLNRIKDTDEHLKILFFSILITVVLGIIPSLILKNWEWFSRSGSLLIIYAIYIVWLDYKGKINKSFNLIKKGSIKKFGEINNNEFSSLVDNLKEQNTQMYNAIEFILLAVGTIIWGYGSVINHVYS